MCAQAAAADVLVGLRERGSLGAALPIRPHVGRVSEIQRTRVLAALAQACAQRGAASVTVAHVVERAGVSRRTFYELFSDIDDCLLAGFEDGLERVEARLATAYGRPRRLQERVRAVLTELLRFLDEEPNAARLLIVETLGAGGEALVRRGRVLGRVADALHRAGAQDGARWGPSRLTAEGVVGAVLSVLHGRLVEGIEGSYLELLNPLVSMVVLPYLGPAAARRELDYVVPAPARSEAGAVGNPLKELHLRLTYRTVRVLMAVAAESGSSNRRVGQRAGIADQGQISKVLARLQALGLVAKTNPDSARGAPNSWVLTARGQEVHGALCG